MDQRYNGADVSNPHGGRPRAFLSGKPGANAAGNNKDFEDE